LTPLEEVSAVLGVTVYDVRRERQSIDGRHAGNDNAWSLKVAPGTPWTWDEAREWTKPVHTKAIKRAGSLNFYASCWGRDPAAPRLTKADGLGILRSLHAHLETTT